MSTPASGASSALESEALSLLGSEGIVFVLVEI